MNIITTFFGIHPMINCYNISLLGSSKLHPCSTAAIFTSGNHKTCKQALIKTASSHLKAMLASRREPLEVKDSTVSQLESLGKIFKGQEPKTEMLFGGKKTHFVS